MKADLVNTIFKPHNIAIDKIYVINLERRPQKWLKTFRTFADARISHKLLCRAIGEDGLIYRKTEKYTEFKDSALYS